LDANGELGYRLVDASRPFCELPPLPPAGTGSVLRVFPAFKALAGRVGVTFRGLGRLAGKPSPWSAEDAAVLVESVPADEVFSSPELLQYFVAFLDENRVLVPEGVQT